SFPFDRRLLEYEVEASRAHARALQGAGTISGEELASILFGLDAIREKALSDATFLEDGEAEDVHHFVEKALVGIIGDAGYKLHSGRSRNEQIATDLRLYVRAAIDDLHQKLSELMDTCLTCAESAGEAAMPSYTHMQRAEPVLVAHWLLAYVEMFARDVERLAEVRKRVNRCPLGSGAVAGTTLPLDRSGLATDLGFDGPTSNSIDATSDRDFALEFVNSLSIVGMHLSRWAEEMILFSTEEFGFLRLPEAYSTGSSAMPQKKNPDLLELVRGKAGRLVGHATALLVSTKGLPLAYNKDLQETQEPLFDAAATVLAVLPLLTGWLSTVEFNFERMQKAAESGFMNAWAAATYLVERGVPFRLAHEQVGKAVRFCLETGCELRDLSLPQWQTFNPLIEADLHPRLELGAVLAIHDVIGGTAPDRVKQAIADARRRVASMQGVAHAHA
ncbi:MAG TPA: argininosuccinate lyase, partial [Terriglobales bacterium]